MVRLSRNGQVALFVAVFVALLFFIGIFYLLLGRSRSDIGTQQSIDDVAKSSALNSQVLSCIDVAADRGLLELGESGGLPLDTAVRAGFPRANVTVNGALRTVIFGLTKNDDSNPLVGNLNPPALSAPQYPGDTIGIGNATSFVTASGSRIDFRSFGALDGYFGDVNFPALCNATGTNSLASRYPCLSYPDNPHPTQGLATQTALEQYIASSVRSCANPADLTTVLGVDVRSIAAPNVSVTFTPEAVLVHVDYALVIGGASSMVTVPFDRRYPVRYQSIEQFAFALAQEDSRNATFDIVNNASSLAQFKQGFTVTRQANVPVQDVLPNNVTTQWLTTAFGSAHTGIDKGADLITVTDANSILDRQQYTFSFLREHRLPMLGPVRASSDCGVDNAADPDETMLTVNADTASNECTVTDAYGLSSYRALP